MDKFSIPSMLSKIWQVLCDISTKAAASNQADWNEADDTSSSYIKNKPTIPAAQIQPDWNQSDNTKADYIKNKPAVPEGPLHLTVKTYFRKVAYDEDEIWVLDHVEYIEADGLTPTLGDQIEVTFDYPRDLSGEWVDDMGVLEISGIDIQDEPYVHGPYPLTMWRSEFVDNAWQGGQVPGSMGPNGLFTLGVKCWIEMTPDEGDYVKMDQTLGYGLSGLGWELGWI